MKNYEFKRSFNDELIDKLKNEDLYKNNILQDIRKGNVFPAVRNNKIDFYHKGGNLFSFDTSGFKTNIKYASVYKNMEEDDYILESKLNDLVKIESFADGYTRIKENCEVFAGIEANGVSSIYDKHSYVASKSACVVLDIEVSLKAIDEKRKQDRIDILVFDKNKKRLIFCEAKHYSNKQIWSQPGKSPEVVQQVIKYEKQIETKGPDIIKAYTNYINVVNKIFSPDLTLPEPIEIYPRVILMVFGFDKDQLSGRLAKLFEANISTDCIYYQIGKVAGIKIENMIKKCKL